MPKLLIAALLGGITTISARAADEARPATPASAAPCVILVLGAAGEPAYGQQFAEWAERWETAARRGGATLVRIGSDPDDATTDRDRLRARLAAAARDGSGPVWLVLIGHGTFDGRQARFNLRGPDFTPAELAEWCGPIQRPLAVIDCSSASGPFLPALSAPGRVVITATRSGLEQNFARFGDTLSAAIGDPAADLDKDGQTSLLEAYLHASRRVDEFYSGAGRLATEHALLDDNGDALGTPAAWFHGIRANRAAKDGAPLDGAAAHGWHLVPGEAERALTAAQRQRRDELEGAVVRLRETKSSQPEDAYYAELERLLVELARMSFPTGVSPGK